MSEMRQVTDDECLECDGLGHNRDVCPTKTRIDTLTQGVLVFRIYVEAARGSDGGGNL